VIGFATGFGCGPADGEAWGSAPLRFRPFQPLEVCCQLGEHVDVADYAELPAELRACDGALLRVIQIGDGGLGNVTPTPSPLPVREGSV
jgi:hypothetical protein